jgi:hypothetical protein
MRILRGPWDIEALYSVAHGIHSTIYYHEDSGFAATPNEQVRMWYVDHNDFNRANP